MLNGWKYSMQILGRRKCRDAGIGWVEVPNKRVGQVVTPIQYRRGLGEEII